MSSSARDAVLSVFFLLSVSVAAAAEVRPASDFSLAVDGEGSVWLLGSEGSEAVISLWETHGWREIHRIKADGAVLSPRLASSRGGLVAAWLEDSGSARRIILAKVDRSGFRILKPAVLRGPFARFDLAPLSSRTLGLLLVESNAVRWVVLDAENLAVLREAAVATPNEAAFPSILPGREPWIAWQEKGETGLVIAVAPLPDKRGLGVRRFRVKGFGSMAAPALFRDAEGRAMVAWQGRNRAAGAVLRSRALRTGKLGAVSTLPAPEGVTGLLSPRAVAGDSTGISAYGWGGRRWSAVRYRFGAQGDVSVSLRSDPDDSVRSPRLAVGAGGEEVWVWREDQIRGGGLRTRGGEAMSRQVPSGLAPPVDAELASFLAFGDSITAGQISNPERTEHKYTKGYIRHLSEIYGSVLDPATFIQKGDPGEKTPEGLVRLAGLLEAYPNLDFVLILEGTNDIHLALTPEDSAANLGEMVDMVRAAGAIPVVATLLPRFDDDKGRGIRAENISKAIYPMARLRGVSICDFQERFPKDVNLFSDLRLHPNRRGYNLMAEIWLEALLTFEGDVDRSFKIDAEDLLRLVATLQMSRGSWAFNPDADFNDDGFIDAADLGIVITRQGREFIIPREIRLPGGN